MDVMLILGEIQPGLPEGQKQALHERLAIYLNDLLLHDFSALVELLYRVDVSEKKLKAVLQANPTEDAGKLLATLVMERQEQKILARQNTPPPASSDEER